uniref:Glycoside hydrolase family 3 protein n=1 Tax=Eiseniibacteriota bacterium TaxID=2212470 RepID=A0A832I2Z5_UNCEI
MDAQRGIARRMVIGLPPGGLDAAFERDFAQYPPAGVIVFARDFADLAALRRLTARLRDLARPRRIFIAMDEEGGWVSQLAGHLPVPPNAALLARGAAGDDVRWAHRLTGARLRALGLDWNLAPVADVHSETRNPVIGPRSFGRDPDVVARLVGEAVTGLREGGVATCLKHFPGHGDTALDSHHAHPVAHADRATLERRELAPFRANLDAHAVMTAHVTYPALDPAQPATFSRAVTDGLLRGALGFRGVAITDALEMKGATGALSPFEAARRALEAGCDLLLFAFWSDEVRRTRLALARALVEGGVQRAAFDAARERLAAFDRAVAPPAAADLEAPLDDLTPPGAVARLEAIAERGLVVRGTLPPAAARLPLRVHEPEFKHGPSLAQALAALGVPLAGPDGPALDVHAVASRVPLAPDETARLAAAAAAAPVVLVGLQADAFLDDVPGAALALSASDATPLTRGVVARRLAALLRPA